MIRFTPRRSSLRQSLVVFSAVAGSSLLFSACSSGPTVAQSQVNVMRSVQTGVVVDVRPVVIEGDETWIGTGTGASAGAILGSSTGSGTSGALAGVAGGALGAIAGREVEEMMTRQDGFEMIIQLDDGSVVSIIQAANVYNPAIGDSVLVTGGNVRLNPNFQD